MYTIQIYLKDTGVLHYEIYDITNYIKNLFGIFNNINLPILKISYSNPDAVNFIIKNICRKVNEHLYDIPENNIANEDIDAANNFLKTKIIWNYSFVDEYTKKNGSYIRLLFKLLIENKFLEVDYYLGYMLYVYSFTLTENRLRTIYETLHDFSDKINIDKKLVPRINYLINPTQEDIIFLENFCPLTQIYHALISKSDDAINYLLINHNFEKTCKYMSNSNIKKIIKNTVFTKYLYYDINCIKWIKCPIKFEKYINWCEDKKLAVECMILALKSGKINLEIIYIKCKLLHLITHEMIVENNWNLVNVIISTSTKYFLRNYEYNNKLKCKITADMFVKLLIYSKETDPKKLEQLHKMHELHNFVEYNLINYKLFDEFFMEFTGCAYDVSLFKKKSSITIQFGSFIFGMEFIVGSDISFTKIKNPKIKKIKLPIEIDDLGNYKIIGVYRNVLLLNKGRFLKIFDKNCISIYVESVSYCLAYFTDGTDEKIIYSPIKGYPKLFPAKNMFSYIIGKKPSLYYFLDVLSFV